MGEQESQPCHDEAIDQICAIGKTKARPATDHQHQNDEDRYLASEGSARQNFALPLTHPAT
jgi:hypothetical protein